MARTVTVTDAKLRFSRLIDEIAAGDEVVITRAGRPVARLVPYRIRELGSARGQIWIAPDFDAPMPDEWLDEWER